MFRWWVQVFVGELFPLLLRGRKSPAKFFSTTFMQAAVTFTFNLAGSLYSTFSFLIKVAVHLCWKKGKKKKRDENSKLKLHPVHRRHQL